MTCTVSPVQCKPSPEYPELHVQIKEPFVSLQVAITSHGSLAHSLMSRNIYKRQRFD